MVSSCACSTSVQVPTHFSATAVAASGVFARFIAFVLQSNDGLELFDVGRQARIAVQDRGHATDHDVAGPRCIESTKQRFVERHAALRRRERNLGVVRWISDQRTTDL